VNNIVVFGAGGRSGRAILYEARSCGHQVTAAVRNPAKYADLKGEGVELVAADAMDPKDVREVARGHDTAVNATRSAGNIEPDHLIKLNQALLTGLSEAGVQRLLIVGGAGVLEVEPGLQLVDTPAFPESAKPRGLAHREALKALQATDTDIDWVYVTPPPNFVADGARHGAYRVGRNRLLIDECGNSEISYADYALGIVEEIESPRYHNECIMLTY
jgi:putative NADH-flavin reductase